MTRQLTYEVVADGGTDRALLPILRWAIHRLDPGVELLEPEFHKRHGTLQDFFGAFESRAMLTFVHRDSERESLEKRLEEFAAVPEAANFVPVIPVRMTEAWLLVDGSAIAQAADRPNARVATPGPHELEQLPDPKRQLESLLLKAAGDPTGRRGKKFKASLAERRVNLAELIEDYSPLEQVPAFQAFQKTLAERYPYTQG